MKKMKKIFLITVFSISLLLVSIQGLNAGGANCPTEGLVPCGTEGCPCEFCDFFVLIDRIIDFVLFKIVPVVAALMLVIGGLMFFFAGGSPETLGKAKKLFTSVVMGLIIIFGAYLIIGFFLQMIGLNDWTTEIYKNWWEKGVFEFKCE